MRVRSNSLFWTFAGAFLMVVVAATVLQVTASIAVLRPLALQGARQRAQATLDRVSRQLAELPDAPATPDIGAVLRTNAPRERGELLVFSARGGRVIHDRRIPPEVHREIVVTLAAAGLADSLEEGRLRPPAPGLAGPEPLAFERRRPERPMANASPGVRRRDRPPPGEAPRLGGEEWPPPGRPPNSEESGWRPQGPPPGPGEGERPPGLPPGAENEEWRPPGPPPGAGNGEWRPPGPPPGAGNGEWRPPGPPPGAANGEWRPPGPPPGAGNGEWRPPGPPPEVRGRQRLPVRRTARDTAILTRRPTEAAFRAREVPNPDAGLGGPPAGPSPPESFPDRPDRGREPASAPLPAERSQLLAHRSVERDGKVLGELAVVGPVSGASLWSLPESRGLLLVLPFAVLVSGGAGLFMVRMLVRRLNALERVTERVAGGDLGATDDRGLDEIGRLEDRFNRMADRVVTARARLEETDRQRRRLLADISHELATPLTSIRGYVETLLDPGVTTSAEERAVYLEDVLEESKRLDSMIAELFDLARLEAGAMPLKRVRLDWMELCRNTTRRMEPRFRAADLSLVWVGASDPAWLRADGRRLEEVVENLLTNAIRYVPPGGTVQLSIERVSPPAGERLRLTVRDDGPGIAEEDLPHVFERFFRSESARSMGGTGLGLAIVSEIVRQHGGEVSAQRRELRGSAFIVDLPLDA